MERIGPYVLGGAVSGALIAGIVAAFISTTALVGGTAFPTGSGSAPSGPGSVTVGGGDAEPRAGSATVPGPALPDLWRPPRLHSQLRAHHWT